MIGGQGIPQKSHCTTNLMREIYKGWMRSEEPGSRIWAKDFWQSLLCPTSTMSIAAFLKGAITSKREKNKTSEW